MSIIFKFTQQSIINVIRMFFWNSASDDINIPSVMVYWSDNPTTPSSEFPIASSIINGSGSGQLRIMTITGNSNAKQKHLGCKKIARPRRSSIVNKSATKSSDIR